MKHRHTLLFTLPFYLCLSLLSCGEQAGTADDIPAPSGTASSISDAALPSLSEDILTAGTRLPEAETANPTPFPSQSISHLGKTFDLACCDEGQNVYLWKSKQNPTPTTPTKAPTDETENDRIISGPSGKTAELTPREESAFPCLHITLEDGTKKECELINTFFSTFDEFRWIDEERVVLKEHLNPSMEVYIVYDLKENNFVEYYGLFFTWTQDYSKLYYVLPSPHWSTEAVPEQIVDQDENVYYETKAGEALVNTLVLDETNEYIGFFVETEDEKTDFGILNCRTKAVVYMENDVHYNDVEILSSLLPSFID